MMIHPAHFMYALVTLTFSTVISAVELGIDWSAGMAESGSMVYSLNAFAGFNPTYCGSTPGDDTYKANVAYMAPGMLRMHSWEMLSKSTSDTSGSGWLLDPINSDAWASGKIRNAMTGAYPFGPVLMINIPLWPPCLADSNGRLQAGKTAAFAAYCANLVRIVNVDLGKRVRYWEVTNEQDGDTGYNHRMGDLGAIYKAAAIAMRQVDPSIKIGGPAFARPDLQTNVDSFLAVAIDQIDFVSYHTYSTGDGGSSNASVWDSAAGLGWPTNAIRTALAKVTTRSIETFHDEYNISWSPPDGKMTNIVGAIYDAIAMTAMARAGVSGAMAWNEADGWYGKLENQSGSWAVRPSAHVYQLFNNHLRGRLATTTTSDISKVDVLAVASGSKRSLALINRAGSAQLATITIQGWHTAPVDFTVYHVTATGLAQSTVSYSSLLSGYNLPKDSVTVLVTKDRGTVEAVGTQFGRQRSDAGYDGAADQNTDGRIDAVDLRGALP